LSRSLGLGGPVGFFHASLGFSAAVLVARTWEYVAQEAHCSITCPSLATQVFQLHHFYYGVVLVVASATILGFAGRQRVRWDSSLFLGIGTGLLADEIGLLILTVPYSHPFSILVLAVFAAVLFLGVINSARRDGTHEFRVLDHSDLLAVAAILLLLSGVLYVDRPIVPSVQLIGIISWLSAGVLLVLFGRTHFRRILVGPG
jgi:hypothetical protein